MLTILSVISCYGLLTRCVFHPSQRVDLVSSLIITVPAISRNGRTRHTAIILCLAILALFTSTTIYLVIRVLDYHTSLMSDFIMFAVNVCSGCFDPTGHKPPKILDYPNDPLAASDWTQWAQSCASTAALTVNVRLHRNAHCVYLT